MTTPIEHVVVIVKENHTFDNYFGTFPGANGIILPQAPNPPLSDNDHRHTAWMNRDTQVATDVQYKEADIPGYFDLARRYTLCDNYFSEVTGPSTPNHLMLICGHSPVINNPTGMNTPSSGYVLPSVPRSLSAAGLSWGAYGGFPYPCGWVAGLPQSNGHTSSAFAKDAKAGNLPSVSWVYGGTYSEHPPQNVTDGMTWTMQQIEAIAAGPLWASCMIFITWDDWGGWYDHVTPMNVEPWNPGIAQHISETYITYRGDQFRYGSRVPCLVVGPYAKPGHITHQLLSHVCIPRFIEDNFGLPMCGGRDAASNGMTDCYDYTQTPLPPYEGQF